LVTLLIAAAAAPLDYIHATSDWVQRYYPRQAWSTASPTGDYIVWHEEPPASNLETRISPAVPSELPKPIEDWVIRLSDGRRAKILRDPLSQANRDYIWVTPDTMLFTEDKLIDANGNPPGLRDLANIDIKRFHWALLVRRVRMDAGGKLHETSFWAERRKDHQAYASVSPGRQMLFVVSSPSPETLPVARSLPVEVRIWNLRNLRQIGRPALAEGLLRRRVDWLSDTQIGFRDATGQHVVRVVPPEAKQ
jgi:hypothetical protein